MNEDFSTVVQEEAQRLYGFCFRLTGNAQEAEDLCQEALARAFKSFHRFEGRSQVSTWLYRIALNAWKNNMRKKKSVTIFGFFRSQESSDSDNEFTFNEPKGKDAPVGTEWERADSERLLQSALKSLSDEEREIIVLRDLEDKSYEDLSQLLEVPLGTVKSRLARAREALRLKLMPLLKASGEIS